MFLVVGPQIRDPALGLSVQMKPGRIIAEGAGGTGNQINATVGTGLDQRKLYHNGATQCGFDERGINIAAGKALPAARVVSRERLASVAQGLFERTGLEPPMP